MRRKQFQVLLADDDMDDCLLFSEALEGLDFPFAVTNVGNGKLLMNRLQDQTIDIPDVLFLDLNMPLKNGLECLADIKKDQSLQNLRVIIISTSSDNDIVAFSYKQGAHYFIKKPSDFVRLKQLLREVMSSLTHMDLTQPAKVDFLLTGD